MPTLPPVLVLTDRRQSEAAGRSLAESVGALRGVDGIAVVYREKELEDPERLRLGREIADTGVPLIVSSDAALAGDLGAIGVHLAADDPSSSFGGLVGRSCHGDNEIEQAGAEALDYVTLSPVFETSSKPGYGPGLRLVGLSRSSASASMPVYALGGVTPANAGECIGAGATGVAVMGAVMSSPSPADVVNRLVEAVSR